MLVDDFSLAAAFVVAVVVEASLPVLADDEKKLKRRMLLERQDVLTTNQMTLCRMIPLWPVALESVLDKTRHASSIAHLPIASIAISYLQ